MEREHPTMKPYKMWRAVDVVGSLGEAIIPLAHESDHHLTLSDSTR
jgi:hypothetical protein